MIGQYKIITICGSARFKEQHLKVQSELTLQGNIVIPCVFFDNNGSKSVWDNLSEAEKVQTKALDRKSVV